MGSCSAATGCCSLSVSPGKDYSLTSTDSRGVALQMALVSSTQPAPCSHEQPSRNRAGKPCSSFFFWSTNEIWTFTTSQCFPALWSLHYIPCRVRFYSSVVSQKYVLWVIEIHPIQYTHLPKSLEPGDSRSGPETQWSPTTFKTISSE